MTPPSQDEEWGEVNRIFEKLILLSPSEQPRFLEEVGRNQPRVSALAAELLATSLSVTDSASSHSEVSSCVFLPGQLVAGRFRIVRFINRGGMGEVYEAVDERLSVSVALKTIRPELAENESIIERFRREIRVAQQVAHPSLCRVFDLVEHHDALLNRIVHCLSMELLSGDSLSRHLNRSRPLSTAGALPLIRQIASALKALHDKQIIHRDLKPTNIMLEPDGSVYRAVVTDFGLARSLHDDKDIFGTRVEMAVGAPYFMAPELFSGERPSVASDIYALGLVIDEMVTRSRAFTADSSHVILYQKLREKPVPPTERADNLPLLWEQVILRCLESEPGRRFQSAGEIVEVLDGRSRLLHVPRAKGATRRLVLRSAMAAPVVIAGGFLAVLALKPVSAEMIVFPFINDSGSQDFDYICQITGTEIVRRLSNVQGIRTVRFYDPRASAPGKLDARFLLEGHLDRIGDRVEIILSLTDNTDGQTVWTRGYDILRKDSTYNLQTEITQDLLSAIERDSVFGGDDAVAERIEPFISPLRRLVGSKPAGLAASPTQNSQAWDLYGKAHDLLESASTCSTLDAIALLKDAVAADPRFALAYADLARAELDQLDHYNNAPASLLEDAQNSALQAVACDPKLAESHLSLAAVQQGRWEWEAATASYRKAISLRAAFPRALRWFAGMLVQFGSFTSAFEYVNRAIYSDPYESSTYVSQGCYLYYARRLDEAARVLQKAVKGSAREAAHRNLAIVYGWHGRLSDGAEREHWYRMAAREIDAVEAFEGDVAPPDTPWETPAGQMRGEFYCVSQQREKAAPYLSYLHTSMENGNGEPAGVAAMHSLLGEEKIAIELLERAFVRKGRDLMYVKVDPYLENLRGNPQFQSILQGMGLSNRKA